MWSRPIFFLIVSISIRGKKSVEKGKKGFRLFIPIPIYLALMLVDIVDDFSDLARILSLGMIRKHKWEKLTHGAIKVGRALIFELILSSGPVDLVDINCGNEDEQVKVRCLLR